MQDSKKRASILYGFSEGSWQGKRLRAELRSSGFVITKFTDQADVIIAHSGGCYMLPQKSTAKVVLLVGLPYNKSLHPISSLKRKYRTDIKNAWWYKNLFFNTIYFFAKPASWIKIWRAWANQLLPAEESSVIAIRNKNDSFTHPTDLIDLSVEKSWSLASLPGHHDDIWLNPKIYVDIINRRFKDA